MRYYACIHFLKTRIFQWNNIMTSQYWQFSCKIFYWIISESLFEITLHSPPPSLVSLNLTVKVKLIVCCCFYKPFQLFDRLYNSSLNSFTLSFFYASFWVMNLPESFCLKYCCFGTFGWRKLYSIFSIQSNFDYFCHLID